MGDYPGRVRGLPSDSGLRSLSNFPGHEDQIGKNPEGGMLVIRQDEGVENGIVVLRYNHPGFVDLFPERLPLELLDNVEIVGEGEVVLDKPPKLLAERRGHDPSIAGKRP